MIGRRRLKIVAVGVTLVALAAAPLFAQEPGGPDAPGYVSAFGSTVWGGGNSTGSVLFEAGIRIAPHVMVFGNVGRFADLQADLQPTLDASTTALSGQGLGVTSAGTLPAWYGVGGLRAEILPTRHAMPYVLGGVGAARLNPTTHLTFAGGAMPDGSAVDVGSDVTAALITGGSYSAPPASTALMMMLGGGVQVPLFPHWAVDLGYRYSRIAADTSLSATALNTNAMSFGFGYRF
jgi:opacity protein-like surface antigen